MSDKHTSKTEVLSMDKRGELQNAYLPLQNLISKKGQLGDFTTPELNFDRYTPVDMIITDEYDGSNNIIINDDKNTPKLINDRISIQENRTFLIPEHNGNKVTNIYEEETFDKDTQLLKLYDHIPKLEFQGLYEGGSFKVGSYVFYFKLADADDNLTNIVQESGIVQVHVGTPNTVKVRMGMEDENASKLIKFKLSEIDKGFDYVKIFYERSSSQLDKVVVKQYYMIKQHFPIRNSACEILLTGEEETVQIDLSDIQTEFADIQSAKTQAIVDNVLFMANTTAYVQDYTKLLQIAWRIVPEAVYTDAGSVYNQNYTLGKSGMYYNASNVYYNVGYWPEEFYRFGIVYIYNNNLLSPVFNIQGCDMSALADSEQPAYTKFFKRSVYNNEGTLYKFEKHEQEPDSLFFNKEGFFNSKGVVKLPNKDNLKCEAGVTQHTPIGIKFDLSHICTAQFTTDLNYSTISDITYEKEGEGAANPVYSLLKKLNIKGFFFVRQKRIPTIIAQGMVVGLTGKEHGAIPVLKSGAGYQTKSFLNKNRQIIKEGSTVNVLSEVTTKALLVPDYDVNLYLLNQMFNGLKFQLTRRFGSTNDTLGDHFYTKLLIPNQGKVVNDVKLTAIPKNTKAKTDGENYFQTLIGEPEAPFKVEDVSLNWRYTYPQKLTCSTSLIRGQWGNFVGMSSGDFNYGDIVDIRLNTFKDELQQELEYEKRFKDHNPYASISPRFNIKDLNTSSFGQSKTCFRGDCYGSVFTHRMMNNFMDPEIPDNSKIVDPNTWVKNYLVRCTGYLSDNAVPNLAAQSSGFYFPFKGKPTGISVLLAGFAFLLGAFNAFDEAITDPEPPFEHEVCEGFEIKNSDKWTGHSATEMATHPEKYFSDDKVRALSAVRSETDPLGKSIKNIFEAEPDWELHGISLINRADVNAVDFGQWITFPICSPWNLALRDVDFNLVVEETKMQRKRAFYPLEEMDPSNHLMESNVINGAALVTLSQNRRPAYQTVPFVKQEYFNRIYWSKPNIAENFINSYRMVFDNQYKEYNKEFGSITKIVPALNNLFVVFLHGIGVLPVTRAPLNVKEASPFLCSKHVLPDQVVTISKDYGSMWKDSVIQTPSGLIYGVDTVAKKIWRYAGKLEHISDHRVTKFLNDWINLSEFDFNEYQGHINVKSHYNEFKHDVMFTFYKDIPYTWHEYKYNEVTEEYETVPRCVEGHIVKSVLDTDKWEWFYIDLNGNERTYTTDLDFLSDPNHPVDELKEVDLSGNLILDGTHNPKLLIDDWKTGKTWHLCFNELLQQFITFYDWYPVESANVDNIWFSFDKERIDFVYNADSEKPDALKDYFKLHKLSPFKFYPMNKVFIDKMFTESTRVYIVRGGDLTIILDVPKPIDEYTTTYLSVYYKGQDPFNKEIHGASFGKDPEWRFDFVNVTGQDTVTITAYEGTYLAEVHFTQLQKDIQHLTGNDPVLNYQELRNNEAPQMYLWKHGLAGIYDNQGKIKPTHWYGQLHEFNFEFVVSKDSLVQKIFNNMKIISNKTAPNKFEYEVVGEGYEWYKYKPIVKWINENYLTIGKDPLNPNTSDADKFTKAYKEVLNRTYEQCCTDFALLDFPSDLWEFEGKRLPKLPFMHIETCDRKGRLDKSYHRAHQYLYWDRLSLNPKQDRFSYNCSEPIIVIDELLNEQRVHTESLGNDMDRYGRVRGNMQYLEDLWDVEIRPVRIEYAYLDQNGELNLIKAKEARHRDKYIKVKIRYSGEDLAVVQAVLTMFDYSFA